ncbi:MAG: DUF5666 domain-containing protein [Pseudomonadota bacterium]
MNVQKTQLAQAVAAALVSTLTLTGCGGGGGGGGSTAPAAGAAPTTPAPATNPAPSNPPPANPGPGTSLAISRGTITGFGSVFINGTRYGTDNALFLVDGKQATQNDLSVGMVVKVSGDLDDGEAAIVRYDEDFEGPVDAVGADSLTVLGQTVLIDATTEFDGGLTLADTVVGDVLEVSGLRNADDALVASYIERSDDADEYEVTGRIADLDSVAQTFRIGGLLVNYAVAELDDLDAGLANGLLVAVTDEQRAYSPGDLTLTATAVDGTALTELRDDDDELDDDFDDESDGDDFDDAFSGEGADLDVEGLISAVNADGSFVLEGFVVRLTDDTEFEYGDVASLAPGARVEVEGELNANGELIAEEIEFADNEARVAGTIEAIDLDTGELIVFGVPVRVLELDDDLDEIDDGDDEDIRSLAGLMIGDRLEIEGVAVDAELLADDVERLDANDETALRGVATSVDAVAGTVTILGVTVTVDAATEFEIDDDDEIGRAAFFDALVAGQSVVEAEWDGSVIDATVPVSSLEPDD